MKVISLKKYLFILTLILSFLFLSCKKENQIIVTLKSVENKTRQPRINTFDKIEIRKAKFGFIKGYEIVGEFKTDSLGYLKVKLEKNEEYWAILKCKNMNGWAFFDKNWLNKSQEIIIEAKPPEKRQYH